MFLQTVILLATEEIEAVRDDLIAACRLHRLSDKQIADRLGIGPGQFSDQKELRGHLSLYRVKNLPLAVQIDFWKLHGKRLGLTVLEDTDLAAYLSLRVARFKSRQLKMRLATEQARESA